MIAARNSGRCRSFFIYALLLISALTVTIISFRSDALTRFKFDRKYFPLIAPLTLKVEQQAPGGESTKGSKGYPVRKIETDNDKLLFVCVVNLEGSYLQKARFKLMIEQGILSISIFYPGANVLISYGEVGTKPNLSLPATTRVQLDEIATKSFNEEGRYTSFGRMKAYAEIINNEFRKNATRDIIFYDADMLFIGNHFRRVFGYNANWEIGLTFRNMQKFPVNCGLMLVNHDGLEKGHMFWRTLLSYYDAGLKFHGKAIRKNDTVADQLATCKVIEGLGNYYTKEREHVRKLVGMNNMKILLLPSRRWNWTPKPMCYIDSQCAVLHFKGNKKVHMAEASKILHRFQERKRSIFFRNIAELGRDKESSRRSLKKGCSD